MAREVGLGMDHPWLCSQDCTSLDEHGIAAALLPLVTAFCRVSVGSEVARAVLSMS